MLNQPVPSTRRSCNPPAKDHSGNMTDLPLCFDDTAPLTDLVCDGRAPSPWTLGRPTFQSWPILQELRSLSCAGTTTDVWLPAAFCFAGRADCRERCATSLIELGNDCGRARAVCTVHSTAQACCHPARTLRSACSTCRIFLQA